MARVCVLFLVFLAWWVYAFKVSQASDLVLGIGDKCDSNSSDVNSMNSVGIDNKSSSFPFPPGGMCDPLIPLECMAGRCQCKRGFTLSRNGTKCLEVGRNGLDSGCDESIQCWKSLMGRLSECSTNTGKCQCYQSDTLHIVFHQGRCYYGEGLGDFCQIEGLCSATTQNATCRSGTCQCKEGFVPSWDKSRCLQIATQGLNSSCEENVQCEKSALGTLSECNQETLQCQCYQIPMLPTVFHGEPGRCYFGASLGDVCQVSPQCLAKTENSLCGRDGKCHCLEGHVANANFTTCLPIAAPADGTEAECVEDIQCTKALGHFSRCNILKQKCECFLPSEVVTGNRFLNRSSERSENYLSPFANDSTFVDSETTSMVIIGSKCYSAKGLGKTCKFNRQCSAITAHSVCYDGICECQEDSHVPSQDGRKCLEIAKMGLNFPCDEDRQCQKGSLGPLSHCSRERNKCECSSILPVVYYENKCYFHRQLGASCETNSECQAGSNYLAECIQGRCQCPYGTFLSMTDYFCQHSKASHSVLGQDKNYPVHIYVGLLNVILSINYLQF